MRRYQTTRVFAILLIVIVVVIAIVALVSAIQATLSGSPTKPVVADTSQKVLLGDSPERAVSLRVRGPIVSDEAFRSYVMTISPTQRTLVTYQGYNNTVIDSVTLPNNSAAYSQFVYALDRANLVKGTMFTGSQNDTRGICAAGELYDFSVLDGASVMKDLWTSSCGGSPGSLDANLDQLQNLFMVQMPQASSVIAKTNL